MSASSTRVAVAAGGVVVLAVAGVLGWRHIVPASAPAIQLAMSAPGSPPAAGPTSPESAKEPLAELEIAKSEIAKSETDPGKGEAPSFDIVRVEPSGDALLAGRSKPNATVALVARGKVVAQTEADAGGNFVMTPPALQPGDYALSLREGQGAAAKDSTQSVIVSVPASKTQPVVVALAEPGKATTLLSAPPEAKSPAPAPAAPAAAAATPASAAKLAIRSVELENGSGLFASGVAPPGTDVRVYLNDSHVADVIAAAAGRWTVTVRKGLSAGRYAVRADTLKPDRTVEARVEVPFDVPPMASGTAETPAFAPLPTAKVAAAEVATMRKDSPADVVVDDLQTEFVTRGDNLWRISRKRLGHGVRYTEIYAANAAQIRDPKLVFPGQVFVLPRE